MENTLENKRLADLRTNQMKEGQKKADNPIQKAKDVLSFGKKISKHWLIIPVAIFFDILALIPIISVVFNFIFGGILFLYFGPKKKLGESELTKIFLPIAGGSVFDFFFSFLPINTATALFRIGLS